MACSKCNKTSCTCTATLCTNPLIHTLDQAFSIIGTNYNGPQIGNTPVTTEHTIYTALYTVLNTGIVATNTTRLCCPDCTDPRGFYFLGDCSNLAAVVNYFTPVGKTAKYPCCIEYKTNIAQLDCLVTAIGGTLPPCCNTDFMSAYNAWMEAAELGSLPVTVDYNTLNDLELIEASAFNGYSGLGIMFNYLQTAHPELTPLDYYGLYIVIVTYGIVVKCGDCNITIGSANLFTQQL
jgi:hypothetical protein